MHVKHRVGTDDHPIQEGKNEGMKEVLRLRARCSSTSRNYDLGPLQAMEKEEGMKEVRGKRSAISNALGGNAHLRLQIGIIHSSGPIAMFCFD